MAKVVAAFLRNPGPENQADGLFNVPFIWTSDILSPRSSRVLRVSFNAPIRFDDLIALGREAVRENAQSELGISVVLEDVNMLEASQ